MGLQTNRRFEILPIILGFGSYGVVHACTDFLLGVFHAIKLIKYDHEQTFHTEVDILTKTKHTKGFV